MANPKARRDRLLALLPRIFAAQPESSAIGVLLDALASVLADLDTALEQTLRDRWVTLAGGSPPSQAEESAPELLGHLLGVNRLRWRENQAGKEIEQAEATEAFRRRLLLTAETVTRGLTTPRALLALALASLGTELCPQLQLQQDTTLGWGMPSGARRRCPLCQERRKGPCPQAEQRLVEAWITDNPPLQQRIELQLQPDKGFPMQNGSLLIDTPALTLHGLGSHGFLVNSVSLVPDIPVLRLQALDKPVCYPVLYNYDTHEICLFAGELQPGETLSLWPQIGPEEWERFDSHEATGHHPWRYQYPQGSAVIIDRQNRLRDVSKSVFYLQGPTFDDALSLFARPDASEGVRFIRMSQGAVFDDPKAEFEKTQFAVILPQVRTPQVRPGENHWYYQLFTQYDIRAVAGQDPGALLEGAPLAVTAAAVVLTLSWWQRPLATFRLRVPRNDWVRNAERQGALALLKDNVERARAAGVRALVDFPEPVYREVQVFSEAWRSRASARWQASADIREGDLGFSVQAKRRESHELGEAFSIRGIFDTTRLDWTHLD